MAHVVGVPKRDPCQKCQLPVFLAERLVVGKKVYHRTCLKCARCQSQLTPGSFYETEVDDEYCCETCPDEESEKMLGAVGSIADRLAFFEKTNDSGNKLLEKSVSDEEKTKSLQRLNENSQEAMPSYKMDAALSNFLNASVDANQSHIANADHADQDDLDESDDEDEHNDQEQEEEEASVSLSKSVQSDSFEVVSSDEEPPQLPSVPPPEEITPTPTHRFTATAQLQLTLKNSTETENLAHTHEKPLPKTKLDDLQFETTTANDKINNNGENMRNTEMQSQNILDLSPFKSINEEVTKDNHAATKHANETAMNDNYVAVVSLELMRNQLQELETESTTDPDLEPVQISKLEAELTPRLETNAETTLEPQKLVEHEQEQEKSLEMEVTEPMSVVNEHTPEVEINNNTNDNTNTNNNNENLGVTESNLTSNIATPAPLTAEIVPATAENSQVPESMQPKVSENADNKTETLKPEVPKVDETQLEISLKVAEKEQLPAANVKSLSTPSKLPIEEYPEDLNPFQSDDDETVEEDKENRASLQHEDKKLNPFDSSDDEIELEKLARAKRSSTGKVPPPRPPPPRILNPFGNDTNSEVGDDLNFSRRSSINSSLTKAPVPTPRQNL